jgi:hypothetical protein
MTETLERDLLERWILESYRSFSSEVFQARVEVLVGCCKDSLVLTGQSIQHCDKPRRQLVFARQVTFHRVINAEHIIIR